MRHEPTSGPRPSGVTQGDGFQPRRRPGSVHAPWALEYFEDQPCSSDAAPKSALEAGNGTALSASRRRHSGAPFAAERRIDVCTSMQPGSMCCVLFMPASAAHPTAQLSNAARLASPGAGPACAGPPTVGSMCLDYYNSTICAWSKERSRVTGDPSSLNSQSCSAPLPRCRRRPPNLPTAACCRPSPLQLPRPPPRQATAPLQLQPHPHPSSAATLCRC